jgi:hypothetical protein
MTIKEIHDRLKNVLRGMGELKLDLQEIDPELCAILRHDLCNAFAILSHLEEYMSGGDNDNQI